jgi:hypothetical protein
VEKLGFDSAVTDLGVHLPEGPDTRKRCDFSVAIISLPDARELSVRASRIVEVVLWLRVIGSGSRSF